ncbi:MAG: hypothetical protein LLG04_01875 [Parachlamydia sp.]|nr:hypothetical protein [Parachlamydia sp.]
MKIGLSNLETGDLARLVHHKNEGRLGYLGVVVRRLGYLFTTFRWLDHATILSQIQVKAGKPEAVKSCLNSVFTNATLTPDFQSKIERLTQAITPDRPAKPTQKKEIEPLEDITQFRLPGSKEEIFQQYHEPIEKLQDAYRKMNISVENSLISPHLTQQEKELLKVDLSDKEHFAWQLSFLNQSNPLDAEKLGQMCRSVGQRLQSAYFKSEGQSLRAELNKSLMFHFDFPPYSLNKILDHIKPTEKELYQQIKSAMYSDEQFAAIVQQHSNWKEELRQLEESFHTARISLAEKNQIFTGGAVSRFKEEIYRNIVMPLNQNSGALKHLKSILNEEQSKIFEQLCEKVFSLKELEPEDGRGRKRGGIEPIFEGQSHSEISKNIQGIAENVRFAIQKMKQEQQIQISQQLKIDQTVILAEKDLVSLQIDDGLSSLFPKHIFWVNKLSDGRYEVTLKTIAGALPPLNADVTWPSYKVTPLRIVSTQTIPPGGGISFSTLPDLINRYRFECGYSRQSDRYGYPLYWMKMIAR